MPLNTLAVGEAVTHFLLASASLHESDDDLVWWALVRRFSPDPERLLRRLVPSVVVLSFVPDFFQFGEGEVTGVVALLLMHIAVAVIAVPTYYRVMPLSSVR